MFKGSVLHLLTVVFIKQIGGNSVFVWDYFQRRINPHSCSFCTSYGTEEKEDMPDCDTHNAVGLRLKML